MNCAPGILAANGLVYRLGKSELISRVSVSVRANEFIALVGPNGAGKSTLLRLLSGELPATTGEVQFGGKPLAAWDRVELARSRALLAQSSELSFAFVVEDVVRLGRSPHGDGHAPSARAIIESALAATDCLGLRDRLYVTLSGGEQQRVHAARVLAQVWERRAVRALFLDEPTASLDLVHQHRLLTVARELTRANCAVVCVLHDLNLAAQYADRVLVLNRGTLWAEGSPAGVLTPRSLAEVFEVEATVAPHATLDCPVISVLGPLARPRAVKEREAHDTAI